MSERPAAAPPTDEPSPYSEQAWRAFARDYLQQELGVTVSPSADPRGYFDDAPLEGEGAAFIFPFDAAPAGKCESYFVVVGRTTPNYYPRWSLSLDEAYSVHVGTRFMLTVGISRAEAADSGPYDAAADIAALAAQIAPREAVENVELAAMFRLNDQFHAVCRARIGGEEVYVLARDCPPGFYRQTHLPPHVVYRMHLGNVLRQEARDERRATRPAR